MKAVGRNRRLLAFLKPYKKQFVIGQAAMLIASVSGLAFPWAIKSIFDTLFQKQSIKLLLTLIGIMAALLTISAVTNYIKNYTLGVIGNSITRDVRVAMYEKLNSLPLHYYSDKKSGDIVSSMTNDINMLQQMLSTGLAYLVQQLVSLAIVVVILFKIDWVLAITGFSTLPVILIFSRIMGKRAKSISAVVQKKLGYITSFINETISGIDVIKAYVLEKYTAGWFEDENRSVLAKSILGLRVQSAAGMVVSLLGAFQLILIAGIGSYRVFMGVLTPGDLIAFILYAEMIVNPISMLSGIYMDIQKSFAAVDRIFEILDTENKIESCLSAVPLDKIQGSISFRDVAFSYREGEEVLNNINLEIHPGETVAIVGPSGIGKTTIFNLILHFYNPSSGSVMIDGVDIREIDPYCLRQNIAIVPQNTYLFGVSVRENIAYGKLGASSEEIMDAARMANAHEFIACMEKGYDTLIGERGINLSGGQRQRIAIARAFLKNPKILLLDEATSALDTSSEIKVQEAVEKLMKGRTTLIIAHRLSTIKNADKILVLGNKKVLAQGSHNELLINCPLYKELYTSQYSAI